MDVDDEDGNTANSGDDAMDEDVEDDNGEGSSKRKKKKKGNLERRKSQLDVAALSNEQAALAALEGNQMLHLRLRKKYYAEALNFIRQIEAAMDTVAQLLGSTNKLEVLEAMRFFQTAQVYDFENAQVG